MRGVPVRVEIGPKDVQNNNAVLARRDVSGREGKQFVSQDGIVEALELLLGAIQTNLLEDARAFRDQHISDVGTYDEMRQVIESGNWARAWWNGTDEDEQAVKDETGATIRCFPFDQPGGTGACVKTGQPAQKVALIARAY